MKFVLFNMDGVEVSDLTELTDAQCIELANKDGHIFTSLDDFQSAFNAEKISTAVHQLRVVKSNISTTPKYVKKALKYLGMDGDLSDDSIKNIIRDLSELPDQSTMIDHVLPDDICPAERFEYTFIVKGFLEQIGYEVTEESKLVRAARIVFGNGTLSNEYSSKFGSIRTEEDLDLIIIMIRHNNIKPQAKKLLLKLANLN